VGKISRYYPVKEFSLFICCSVSLCINNLGWMRKAKKLRCKWRKQCAALLLILLGTDSLPFLNQNYEKYWYLIIISDGAGSKKYSYRHCTFIGARAWEILTLAFEQWNSLMGPRIGVRIVKLYDVESLDDQTPKIRCQTFRYCSARFWCVGLWYESHWRQDV